ncbi:phosphodiester glycosidase family protein [Exiguobacterium sp. s193]|uniref:phosphodiester glycosidase family protein n=1 Tax=Exiguobacterium sp. s193 TaxID=2751207 RepID=UPI001BE6913D|nr:phosphodiester glycosidase family protein [Exiguobacterium sp. s193]
MKTKICMLLCLTYCFIGLEMIQAETVSKGIDYTTRQETIAGNPQVFRQLTVKPDANNYWITTKGRDYVLATEPLPMQLNRSMTSGNRIVAGINGDMYKVATGLPIGLQIQKNEVLISHSVKESALKYPSFVIDGHGRPEIGSFGMVGSIRAANRTLTVHSLNRNENLSDRMGLFTSAHHPSKKIKLYEPSETMKKTVAIVVLQGRPVRSFQLGTDYAWTVGKVETKFRSEIDVPSNSVVLVAFGKQKKPLLELIRAKQLTTQFNLIQLSNLAVRNDIQEAVSGYNWLIKDGIGFDLNALATNHDRFLMIARKARTLIGVGADRTVHMVTVDQARTDSRGITMVEAVAQMQRLGATSALAFDGGGSTEMMVRREGEFPTKTVNYPADGRSRSVTNGLMVATRYRPTNVAAKVIVAAQPEMYLGEKRQLALKLTDRTGQPVDATKKKITLTGTGVSGLQVTAPITPGKWRGKLKVDQASKTVKITVTNRLSGLVVNGGRPIVLKVGQKQPLITEGWFNGRKVTVPQAEKTYQSTGNIANVTKDTVVAKRIGKTTVKVTAGGRTVIVPVTVTSAKKTAVLDGFEKGSYQAQSPYVSSYTARISTKQKTVGRASLAVTYDYSGWQKQNGAMYLSSPNWIIPYPAKTLSLDVYGNRHAPWLRAKLKDATGKSHTVDFVKKVDWKGFKTVQAKLDSSWQAPLKIETIYFVETDQTQKGDKTKHRVYLDQLKVSY